MEDYAPIGRAHAFKWLKLHALVDTLTMPDLPEVACERYLHYLRNWKPLLRSGDRIFHDQLQEGSKIGLDIIDTFVCRFNATERREIFYKYNTQALFKILRKS